MNRGTWWTTVHGVTKESDTTEWLTFSLLIGWWWSDRVALQDSCAQSKVTILHLGSCLSFCQTLVPAKTLLPEEEPKDTVCVPLRKNCLIVAVLSFDCSSFGSAFLHFPDSNYLDLFFGTQGRSVRLKSLSYKQEMGDTERICTQKGPTESRSVSPGERKAAIAFLTEEKPFYLSRFVTSAWPRCLPGLSY